MVYNRTTVFQPQAYSVFHLVKARENPLHIAGNSYIWESPDKGADSRVTHRTNKLHEILYSTVSQL